MSLYKPVAFLFFPLPVCIACFIAGWLIRRFTMKKKFGGFVMGLGFFILIFFSNAYVSRMLLYSLESKYPAAVIETEDAAKEGGIRRIVVLSGGVGDAPVVPVTSRIGCPSMVRLIEGIRLHKMLPGSALILSGRSHAEGRSDAEVLEDLAVELGVDRNDIQLETDSRNTHQEAEFLKKVLGSDPFYLVTSAGHMPRSMALFKKLGMNPVAAPTDHRTGREPPPVFENFIPRSQNLDCSSDAVYEYLGLAKDWLMGRI